MLPTGLTLRVASPEPESANRDAPPSESLSCLDFLLARELARRSRARFLSQGQFQVARHKAPLGVVAGGAADHHPGRDLRVAGTDIGSQEDLCSFELSGRVLVT